MLEDQMEQDAAGPPGMSAGATVPVEIVSRWDRTRVLFRAEVDATIPLFGRIRAALEFGVKARANLDGANLVGANLARANLARANLARANLDGANLARANLDGANLVGANLARANLAGANLARANLVGANLARANLDGANLVGANLARANLAGANLARANLAGANLVGAYLDGANLVDANLVGAYLDGANLVGANLVGAYLVGATWRHNVKLNRAPVKECTRSDGYLFRLLDCDCGWRVAAGCRFFTMEEAWRHWGYGERAGTDLGAESEDILVMFEHHIEREEKRA
jgi:hypothetical protein